MAFEKRALITGVTGQDGSYLAELLLTKGYNVHGLLRRSSNDSTTRIAHLIGDRSDSLGQLKLHYGDLSDGSCLTRVLDLAHPAEIYNFAGQSDVRQSFDQPLYTLDVNAMGTVKLLEAARAFRDRSGEEIRFFQASSSEMFGQACETPQRESTPFYPRSPYGASKAYAHWITVNYRESYRLHASCGILFNHESPRRGTGFVTRKVTQAAARIKLGLRAHVCLGNLEATRDWGYAPEYVEAAWRILQQDSADDYVIATGESHSVRELCERVFGLLDLDYREFVRTDSWYCRPAEVDVLVGDSSKALLRLGWNAQTTFEELIRIMVDADMEGAKRELGGRERCPA